MGRARALSTEVRYMIDEKAPSTEGEDEDDCDRSSSDEAAAEASHEPSGASLVDPRAEPVGGALEVGEAGADAGLADEVAAVLHTAGLLPRETDA